MKTTTELRNELRLAQEGLEHIHQAWKDGDYDHNYFQYERDRASSEAAITKLERKIAEQEEV